MPRKKQDSTGEESAKPAKMKPSKKPSRRAKANLEGMSQTHGMDNALILRERLLKQFRGHVAQYNAPQEIRQRPVSAESMRILSEGK